MNVQHPEAGVPAIAAAIGEPSRARMLYCLMDGRARTSTELAVVADVSASTASLHLAKLKAAELVTAVVQGKHRYYTLKGQGVAAALEALNVLAGHPRRAISLPAASRLRTARTCYDHMAGAIAVALHDRFQALGWLAPLDANGYMLTAAGAKAFHGLGVDVEAAQSLRRRFAFACLDWSERRPHLGGALGAAVLTLALRKKWIVRDLDSRVVSVTAVGRRDLLARLGIP
jgi:DNA-binding transcriptional ArsR family regulator